MSFIIGDRIETVNDLVTGNKGDQGVCTGLFSSDSEHYISVEMDNGRKFGPRLDANYKKVEEKK